MSAASGGPDVMSAARGPGLQTAPSRTLPHSGNLSVPLAQGGNLSSPLPALFFPRGFSSPFSLLILHDH